MSQTSSTLSDFWSTANERHTIALERANGEQYPWTEDEIFLKYKFTNVFRELDRGTLALREMLPTDYDDPGLIVFNVVWYRLLNRAEHAQAFTDYDDLRVYLMDRYRRGLKMFTGCHMHSGSLLDNLKTIKAVWDDRDEIAATIEKWSSLEEAFLLLKRYRHIGNFIAYEIVTDLRHYPHLWEGGEPVDVNTWANVGPGSRRGMERLGYAPTLETMKLMFQQRVSWTHSCPALKPHVDGTRKPAFELREIEHWLCEFDKYERARLGQGAPKQIYRPH